MAEWNNTVFLNCSESEQILLTLKYVLAKDGYVLSNNFMPSFGEVFEIIQFESSPCPPLVGCCLIPTSVGWSILKTLPFEVLCYYPRQTLLPRLAKMCSILHCCGIQVNLYDGAAILTVESDALGHVCITGGTLDDLEDDSPPFAIQKQDVVASRPLGLLENPSQPFVLSPELNRLVEKGIGENSDGTLNLGQALTHLPAGQWDNSVTVEFLKTGLPMPVVGSKAWYFLKQEDP